MQEQCHQCSYAAWEDIKAAWEGRGRGVTAALKLCEQGVIAA